MNFLPKYDSRRDGGYNGVQDLPYLLLEQLDQSKQQVGVFLMAGGWQASLTKGEID